MDIRKPEKIVTMSKTRMSIATIYPNLLKAMNDRDMSVKDLANVLDISDQAMRRRLLSKANGGTDISAYECHVLCEHFNSAFEWLFATGDRV
jgi:DNA-binding Xre family transcriptional regulator